MGKYILGLKPKRLGVKVHVIYAILIVQKLSAKHRVSI